MDALEEYSLGSSLGLPHLNGAEADAARAFARAIVDHAYRGAPRATVDSAWQAVRDRPWAFEPPPESDPYWAFARRIAAYDPLAHWRQVRAPALLLFGENDERVPARPSAGAITQALLASGGSKVSVRIFPSADHGFRLPPPSPSAWPRTADGYPREVIDWVLATVGAPASPASP